MTHKTNIAIKLATATITLALISSCGMSDEKAAVFRDVYKVCTDSVKDLDIYEKDGTHFSVTDDGKRFSNRICLARAKLYVDGYRIGKTSKESDYTVYQLSLTSNRSVRGIYQELIKSGIEP